ncbi:unnamed protein product, partial [Amoebophrya sp. A25]|eukprot:GSA25T00014223001.1
MTGGNTSGLVIRKAKSRSSRRQEKGKTALTTSEHAYEDAPSIPERRKAQRDPAGNDLVIVSPTTTETTEARHQEGATSSANRVDDLHTRRYPQTMGRRYVEDTLFPEHKKPNHKRILANGQYDPLMQPYSHHGHP